MRRLGKHSGMDEGDDSEHETGIDLAPMLDFVLNLLIFFIITAAFSKEVGLGLSQPPPNNHKPHKNNDKSLTIGVLDNGSIIIDHRVVDAGAVISNVERFHALKPKAPIIVVATEKSPTGVVVGVMDKVRQGGVYNVSIAPAN